MMMNIEIAGKTLHYRSAHELTKKVRAMYGALRSQREKLVTQCAAIRQKERSLERFLGADEIRARTTDAIGGSHNERGGGKGGSNDE